MEEGEKKGNELFPVFLKLNTLKVLVAGGGNVALEKVNALLNNSPGTDITVVAPEIGRELWELAALHPSIRLKERPFFPGDLFNAGLVIAATSDRALNHSIQQEASKRQLLVNVADTPELCDFYLGSIVSRGDLKIAISTNGKSPTLAKRLREVLSEVFPDELQQVLDNLQVIRKKLSGNFSDKVKKLNEITAVLAS